MDTSEDNRSWQQVLRREGKGSQAKVRAPPDDRRVAPYPQHRLHDETPLATTMALPGFGKVGW